MQAMIRKGVMACLLVFAAGAASGEPHSEGLRSYVKARAVLDAGVDATGGVEALRRLKSVRRDFEGGWRGFGQSRRPERAENNAEPFFHERDEAIVYFDYAGGGWHETLKYSQYGHDFEYAIQVDAANRSEGYQIFGYIEEKPLLRRLDASELARLRSEKFGRYPEGALLAALSRPETLQWVASHKTGEVISYADETGARRLLHFDARTRLLSKIETLRDHPVAGDTSAETSFSDYRKVGNLKLPFRYVDRIAGSTTQDWLAVSIELDTPFPEGRLSGPSEFVPMRTPPETPAVRAIADNIYLIEGAYNVLFAVFRDFVLVVEAPRDSTYAEECLRLIREKAPGKPLRVVSTHFHYDHIGGIRPFIASGAKIYATPDAVALIEQAAASVHSMRPDALSRNPAEPLIETLTKDVVLFDGALRAVIFDIGPTDHVTQLLAVHFPHQKTLYQADLWDPNTEEYAFAGADAVILAQRINERGLDVETIVSAHGAPVAGVAALKRALAIRAKYSGQQ